MLYNIKSLVSLLIITSALLSCGKNPEVAVNSSIKPGISELAIKEKRLIQELSPYWVDELANDLAEKLLLEGEMFIDIPKYQLHKILIKLMQDIKGLETDIKDAFAMEIFKNKWKKDQEQEGQKKLLALLQVRANKFKLALGLTN